MMKTLYYGGTILTLAQPLYAEALLVEDGRIKAVGSQDDVAAWQDNDTQLVDLAGRCLMPGFIDAHSHICSFASTLETVPLGDAHSFAEIAAKLRAFIRDNNLTHGEMVTGFGYDHNFLAEKTHPDKSLLDDISRTNPILITHQSGHLAVANSLFLAQSGLTAQTPDPEGGRLGRLNDSKELSGLLEETAFFNAAGRWGAGSTEDQIRRINKVQDIYLRYGITTAQEGKLYAPNDELLQKMADDHQLKLDIVGYADLQDAHNLLQGNLRRKQYHNHYRLGGYKIILDGSPQGRTAWLSQPYEGTNDCAYGAYSDEDVYRFLRTAALEGEQVLAHCNGDAAAEQLLSQYERLAQDEPNALIYRPVMIHAQTVRLDQLPRMHRLGMIASFFVEHVYQWGDIHRQNLGQARATNISPAQSAWDEGIVVTFHQDSPVLPPDMLHTVWSAVNRQTQTGYLLGADQRLTPLQALQAVTINAAYQYSEENDKGTLEAGKLADMVILSHDPLTHDKQSLKDITVCATIKEGITVYQHPSLCQTR